MCSMMVLKGMFRLMVHPSNIHSYKACLKKRPCCKTALHTTQIDCIKIVNAFIAILQMFSWGKTWMFIIIINSDYAVQVKKTLPYQRERLCQCSFCALIIVNYISRKCHERIVTLSGRQLTRIIGYRLNAMAWSHLCKLPSIIKSKVET